MDLDDQLLPIVPHLKPPGEDEMLRLIAYDIGDPKRWAKVVEACQDHGVRVQLSLFECWLEEPEFQDLWNRLQTLIKPEEDRLAAYTLDAHSAHRRLTAGETMLTTSRTTTYVV